MFIQDLKQGGARMVNVVCPSYFARRTLNSVRKEKQALINSIEICLKIRASLRNTLKELKSDSRLVMAVPIVNSMKAGTSRTVLGFFSGCWTVENSCAALNGKIQNTKSREMVSRNIYFLF